MWSLLVIVAFIWAAFHLLFTFINKQKSILPFSRPSATATSFTLRAFHLRVQTTAYNIPHDALSSSLKKRSLARSLRLFYDVGSLVALIGMVLALTFLVHNGATGIHSLARKLLIPPTHINRRSIDATAESQDNKSWIQPIIPGVTVPLTHLPIILFTVLLAQIFHEIGHAIAATTDALPILSSGLSLTLIVPSAFVSFSSTTLHSLPPRSRARISAAGPFHNFLLWALMSLLAWTNIGGFILSFGYRDVSRMGRVVVSVDSQSPLHDYLSPGALITGLDDTLLSSPNPSHDIWDSYLLHPTDDELPQRPTLGWCTVLQATDDTCCTTKNTNTNNGTSRLLSCFVATDNPSTRGCLDPISILTSLPAPPSSTSTSPTPTPNNNNTILRCISTLDCATGFVCTRPDAEEEEFLRLTVYRRGFSVFSGSGKPEVILWSGPREEVWEEVQVDTLLPRHRFIPVSFPALGRLSWEYLLMATLSLYLFNTLPLPYLDGAQFLEAVVAQFLSNSDSDDMVLSPLAADEYDLELQPQDPGISPSSSPSSRLSWDRDRGQGQGYLTSLSLHQSRRSRRSRRRSRFWQHPKRITGLVSKLTLGGLVVCVVVGVGNYVFVV